MDKPSMKLSQGMLFTDFYQLTMAQLYYLEGFKDTQVQFDYFFRNYPDYGKHKAGYCVNAGLEWVLRRLEGAGFGDDEIDCLRAHRSASGKHLFRDDFLEWLGKNGGFESVSLYAVPEGRVIHAGAPVISVRGSFPAAQMLESFLLNCMNYQILVATKASRVYETGCRRPLIEFGMRRAQWKAANAGTRAALIGGADFSSNAGASYALDVPPRGTHAHSMVQAFIAMGLGELEAFRSYARMYPDDCILLVDTVDTLNSGIPNAIKVFGELKKKGHKPAGIRLDSGDLAYLSIKASKMLDSAGFPGALIVLSNQLDEMVIWQIISQIREEAPGQGISADRVIGRLVYGVGTRMIVSEGCAALDGIYKLSAIKKSGRWLPSMKISETPAKIINPGLKNLYRVYDKRNRAVADVLALRDEKIEKEKDIFLHHPAEPDTHRTIKHEDISLIEPMLSEVFREGRIACDLPGLSEIRKTRREDIDKTDPGVIRLINPHRYHVSLTEKLWKLKQAMIRKQTRGKNTDKAGGCTRK